MQRSDDPRTEFERLFLKVPRAELGGLIKEYVAESNHGGWDGFDKHHITGIKALLQDIMQYYTYYDTVGGTPGDPGERYQKLANHINNVNPVK